MKTMAIHVEGGLIEAGRPIFSKGSEFVG